MILTCVRNFIYMAQDVKNAFFPAQFVDAMRNRDYEDAVKKADGAEVLADAEAGVEVDELSTGWRIVTIEGREYWSYRDLTIRTNSPAASAAGVSPAEERANTFPESGEPSVGRQTSSVPPAGDCGEAVGTHPPRPAVSPLPELIAEVLASYTDIYGVLHTYEPISDVSAAIAERIEKATPPAQVTRADLAEAARIVASHTHMTYFHSGGKFNEHIDLAHRLAAASEADPNP